MKQICLWSAIRVGLQGFYVTEFVISFFFLYFNEVIVRNILFSAREFKMSLTFVDRRFCQLLKLHEI